MALTEKRKAANARWDSAHLCRMSLAVPREMREAIDAFVAQSGESVNGFIKRAIAEALERSSEIPDGRDRGAE